MHLINGDTVRSLLTHDLARTAATEALQAQVVGRAGLSDPRSLRMRPSGVDVFYQLKGAYLVDAGVAAYRFAGFPGGEVDDEGRRIVLLDLASGRMLALMAEQDLYQQRVAVELALTIAALRPEGASRLALVGTGRLATSTAETVQSLTPFPEIRVTSRSAARREAFSAEMERRDVVGVRTTSSVAEACEGADVVLTLTTATEPIITSAWCGPGTLVVPAGEPQELADGILETADRLYVDDWEQCALIGDLAPAVAAGRIDRTRLTGTLAELVTASDPAPTGPDECVVAIPQGLTILDAALANAVYRAALDRGAGTEVSDL